MNFEAHAIGRAVELDSRYAWFRLAIATLLGTIGSIGMWSFVVALPAVQADLGLARADASLPYTMAMIGFAFGGIVMGRLSDRFGIKVPVILGAVALGGGYIGSALSPGLWLLAGAHFLMGIGTSATFGPLLADTSHWFERRRGIAIAICSCGNYLAGALWPPLIQHLISTAGWRPTHAGIGIFCLVTMLPLVLLLRRPSPVHAAANEVPAGRHGSLDLAPGTLQGVLVVAGLACCVAMAMPQVHIVAYCGDLGYGPARGAEMLSLMLGFGLIARVGSGFIADRTGGLAALLIGSLLQAVALLLYLGFDSLGSLYVISALFGLFQGGIVPMYTVIVREYFSPSEAATRVGVVMMASLFGMALGGWMSGKIFDLTGSYATAFVNGFAWNLVNIAIIAWLLVRSGWRPARLATA